MVQKTSEVIYNSSVRRVVFIHDRLKKVHSLKMRTKNFCCFGDLVM